MVLTVSEADRSEFVAQGLDGAKIFSVPTGVDTTFFIPMDAQETTQTIVFTGSMDWMPNQDGILFFLAEVYPEIQAKIPNVKLNIVGRKPPQKITQAAAAQKGVTVTGWVEDIRQYLGEAAVCVVPLRVGSGTRLKIFEAMAMGKAVVSTTIGAEGLPVSDRRDILIADSAGDFAARTIELLQNRAKRSQIGDAARRLVETHYSWEAVTAELMQTIESNVTVRG
jgi:glycosyltransferase involved in cell wall biosynthesis